MGIEIERKFLVNRELWNNVVKPHGNHCRQGYLVAEPDKTIRVRVADFCGYITIKGATVGASRSELEYEISIAEVEKTGVSSTGAVIENELIPMVKEFIKYASPKHLWKNKFETISYEITGENEMFRMIAVNDTSFIQINSRNIWKIS